MKLISPTRLQELVVIMIRSNQAAKTACKQLCGNRKYPSFRAVLRGQKVENLTVDQIALINFLPSKPKAVMLEVEKVRDEIILSCQGLVRRLSKVIAKDSGGFRTGELVGEANLLLIKAIYSFSQENMSFLKFAKKIIRMGLKRHVLQNRNGGLSSSSSDYLNLLRAVIAAENQLRGSGQKPDYHSIYEIVHPKWGKTRDFKAKLMGVLGHLTAASEYTPKGEDHTIDYTNDVADQDRLQDQDLLEAQGGEQRLRFDDVLRKVAMSENERAVASAYAAGLTVEELSELLKEDAAKVSHILKMARKKVSRAKRLVSQLAA